jgi:hypothetical protein
VSQSNGLDEGGDPEWSPDGSQIGFWTQHDEALVIDADASGGVAPLDASRTRAGGRLLRVQLL